MNILITCIHWPVASGRYMYDAFLRLGHDVRSAGPAACNNIWGSKVNPKYEWQPDYGGNGSGRFSTKDWEPDLVINMDTAYVSHNTYDCPHVVYTVDNHVRRVDNMGVNFDHYFLAHRAGPTMPVDAKSGKHTWLPCAYDPVWFTPSPIPFADREYDVCMIGVGYPERVELVEAMKAAGLKVRAGTGIVYDQYRDAYHNSRISLCKSVCGDVAQRVFETAAMGCMVLSDGCTDFERLDFDEWFHYVPYSSNDEAIDHVAFAIAHPLIPTRRIASSQAWALKHTWDARAQTILDTMFEGK